jgi:hypothetical protein
MPLVHRLLALVVFVSVAAMADPSTPDGGVDAERAQRGQRAFDDLRYRVQTAEDVAANLTPGEKLMLLSGIICDAQDWANGARKEIKKQRAIGSGSGSVDPEMLQEQKTIIHAQEARITHARKLLGRIKPTSCNSPDAEAVVDCIRAKVALHNSEDADCHVPGFWKYQLALWQLDTQWRDLFFRGRDAR